MRLHENAPSSGAKHDSELYLVTRQTFIPAYYIIMSNVCNSDRRQQLLKLLSIRLRYPVSHRKQKAAYIKHHFGLKMYRPYLLIYIYFL